MARAAEKLALVRRQESNRAAVVAAEEKKADAILVMGYHFELCEVCQEWWKSFA